MLAVGLLATLFSLFMSNVAATVLLAPLVMIVGAEAGVDGRALALLVAGVCLQFVRAPHPPGQRPFHVSGGLSQRRLHPRRGHHVAPLLGAGGGHRVAAVRLSAGAQPYGISLTKSLAAVKRIDIGRNRKHHKYLTKLFERS